MSQPFPILFQLDIGGQSHIKYTIVIHSIPEWQHHSRASFRKGIFHICHCIGPGNLPASHGISHGISTLPSTISACGACVQPAGVRHVSWGIWTTAGLAIGSCILLKTWNMFHKHHVNCYGSNIRLIGLIFSIPDFCSIQCKLYAKSTNQRLVVEFMSILEQYSNKYTIQVGLASSVSALDLGGSYPIQESLAKYLEASRDTSSWSSWSARAALLASFLLLQLGAANDAPGTGTRNHPHYSPLQKCWKCAHFCMWNHRKTKKKQAAASSIT